MTEEEYVAFEQRSDVKHERVNGEVIAMAGGSPRHGLIAANIIGALGPRLRGGRCRALSSDVRVHVTETGLSTYPDVSVVCGAPETRPRDPGAITNPTVIFEVLSASTEGYDRGARFDHYRRIPTLADYVLVSQREQRVLHYRRVEEGWLLQDLGAEDSLTLPVLGCSVPLVELYEGSHEYPDDRG